MKKVHSVYLMPPVVTLFEQTSYSGCGERKGREIPMDGYTSRAMGTDRRGLLVTEMKNSKCGTVMFSFVG